MTNTLFTNYIAAAFPLRLAESIHDALVQKHAPDCERYFEPFATHTDGEEDWQFLQTAIRPTFVPFIEDLQSEFPEGRFKVIGEIQPDTGQGFIYKLDNHVMADLGGRDEILQDLTPIPHDDEDYEE